MSYFVHAAVQNIYWIFDYIKQKKQQILSFKNLETGNVDMSQMVN